MALLLPPVAVVMVQGCGLQLCINLLLCLLGWIPGRGTQRHPGSVKSTYNLRIIMHQLSSTCG